MISKAPISVYTYCIEDPSKIENYESAKADNFKGWVCHHKLETKCPAYRPSRNDLIEWNLYFHRPAEELIFMRHSEHTKLHHLGRKCTVEHKIKTSNSLKGHVISEETKRKISNTLKGCKHSEEFKRKVSENSKTPIVSKLYKEYKANGGVASWNEFQKGVR